MSGSLSDILSDPGIDALLGAAQGFGQAALPTRMPTPFGAVLGAGAGGLEQGLKTSQQLQQGAAQTQAAQMQNQMTKAYLGAIPGVVSPSGGSTGSGAAPATSSFFSNATPSTSGSATVPTPGGSSPSAQQSTDANGNFLVPPNRFVQLSNLALLKGDPASAAKLLEMSQSYAGGPGYAMGQNGTGFAVPGGKEDLRTIYNDASAKGWGGVGPAIAQAGGIATATKSAEAPYAPPITYDQPVLDANGHVIGTQSVQVPVPTWARMNGAGGGSTSSFPVNGAPQTTTTPQAASSAALATLPDDPTRTTAINAALRAGLPVEAWAPWLSTVQTESHWNLNAPDGAAGEIGPGQVKPGTGAMFGYTPQQLRDPTNNLIASARYFAQQWQAGGGDPAKAMTGYNSGNVNGVAGKDYVSQGIGRLAQWGYPGTASSIATSPIGAMPPVAPPPTGMGGTVTLGPQAKANVELGNKWLEPNGIRPGGVTPVAPGVNPAMPGGGVLQAPQVEEVTTPSQVKVPAHVILPNPYDNPNAPATAVPIVIGGATPPTPTPVTQSAPVGSSQPAPGSASVQNPGAALVPGSTAVTENPLVKEFVHERGENLAQEFARIDADAASAKEGNYLFDNLRNDSQSWDMGKFANWEGDGRAWLSAGAQLLGMPDKDPAVQALNKPLADYQAFLKSSGSLLRTAVHDVSSRAAVQEYNLIGQTLPQPTTSKQGFAQVADQWQGANDFRLAKQKFAQSYQNHPQDFNVDFNSQVSPVSFMLNRMAMTPQGQSDMHDMLARLQGTPEGRLAARHMLQQYSFAKQNGLFDGLPMAASTPGGP